MNTSPSSYDRIIDEQASTWAARLDGDVLEASERAALDAWLAETPAHRAALSQYCQLSADLEETLPQLVAAGAVKVPAPKKARRFWSFPSVAGLALAAAAAVAVGLWIAHPTSRNETVVAPLAERTMHTLADGTRVELNANTSLRFENGDKARRVVLAGGGEAIFTVTKDKTRPFTVVTPAGSVTVTGTVFNVRTDANASALDVTVVEGSVNVRPGSASNTALEPIRLTAGQHLSTRNGNTQPVVLTADALEDELAWRNGEVVCFETPLAEVAERFAHYHGRRITVDAKLTTEPIGGRYRLDDLPAFLNALNLMLPVEASFAENGAAYIVPKPPTGSESASAAKP